jgi:hypothetical protein
MPTPPPPPPPPILQLNHSKVSVLGGGGGEVAIQNSGPEGGYACITVGGRDTNIKEEEAGRQILCLNLCCTQEVRIEVRYIVEIKVQKIQPVFGFLIC